MVGDHTAAGQNMVQLGQMFGNAAAQNKEGTSGTVPLQRINDAIGIDGMGTVVKGQGDVFGFPGHMTGCGSRGFVDRCRGEMGCCCGQKQTEQQWENDFFHGADPLALISF